MTKKNLKKIILGTIIIIGLSCILVFRKQIQSAFVFHQIGSFPEIQAYTDNNYKNMKIIGEDYSSQYNMMQIDGFVDNERKKIFTTYICNVGCVISFLSIYEDDMWNVILGEDDISLIEDWGY